MKIKPLFIIATIGIVVGIGSVIFYNQSVKSQPPITVNYNPYDKGIYATGIIESFQGNGSNVNIFPYVAGEVTNIFVTQGQTIKKGTPILAIDDSIQREIVAKDEAQAKAALTQLQELKAQPRKENLAVANAQVDYARASLVNAKDQLDKVKKAYTIDTKSVSKNVLDNAMNAYKIATENLKLAEKQYDLVKAGAWSFDITNQQYQYAAAMKAYQADKALLDKYIVRSPNDGMVLRILAAKGDYVTPQGGFDPYTQGAGPLIQMGVVAPHMAVRCYLDEILVPNLPKAAKLEASMYIRGQNNHAIPLEFVSIQPITIPNIELSDQRQQRVDVRVLPIIFKFKKPTEVNVYPGQLVDIYIKGKK